MSRGDPIGGAAPAHALVIFGASGDLTTRKLVPALAALAAHDHVPPQFAIVGVARSEMSDDEFRHKLIEAAGEGGGERWNDIVGRCRYIAGGYDDRATFERVAAVLAELDESVSCGGSRLYYLATPPQVFPEIVTALGASGMHQPKEAGAFVRLVIEKPYGRDVASAAALDETVHRVFAEEQVYRIDHYLGKETVQNVLALRFANAIFEPVWNRRYVDHVQITVAETNGVGTRAAFYEEAGALRDILQNHLMQVLALVAMEPPATVAGEDVRNEKVKVLRNVAIPDRDLVPSHTVRAQYTAGVIDGDSVPGYREEQGVDASSQTETFVAARLVIDNWRWAGVPFYLRTGKRMAKHLTEVTLTFHDVPHLPFAARDARGLRPNQLIVRVQPDEGITLRFGAKVPGTTFEVRSAAMDFTYAEEFHEEPPDAYERLLHDAMIGDPTLFIRSDEVTQAWEIVQPILDAWADGSTPLDTYPAGTWGPPESSQLLSRDGHQWRD